MTRRHEPRRFFTGHPLINVRHFTEKLHWSEFLDQWEDLVNGHVKWKKLSDPEHPSIDVWPREWRSARAEEFISLLHIGFDTNAYPRTDMKPFDWVRDRLHFYLDYAQEFNHAISSPEDRAGYHSISPAAKCRQAIARKAWEMLCHRVFALTNRGDFGFDDRDQWIHVVWKQETLSKIFKLFSNLHLEGNFSNWSNPNWKHKDHHLEIAQDFWWNLLKLIWHYESFHRHRSPTPEPLAKWARSQTLPMLARACRLDFIFESPTELAGWAAIIEPETLVSLEKITLDKEGLKDGPPAKNLVEAFQRGSQAARYLILHKLKRGEKVQFRTTVR